MNRYLKENLYLIRITDSHGDEGYLISVNPFLKEELERQHSKDDNPKLENHTGLIDYPDANCQIMERLEEVDELTIINQRIKI